MGVKNTILDRAEEWVLPACYKSKRRRKITGRNGGEGFGLDIGARFAGQLPPPETPFDDDNQGCEKTEKDWPHDRPALNKKVDSNISEDWIHKLTSELKADRDFVIPDRSRAETPAFAHDAQGGIVKHRPW